MTIKLTEDEQAGFEVLAAEMSADLALEIVKHRRRKKAHITARIARSLIREYKAYGNVEKAADIHLMRAWTGFEAAWVTKAQRFTDQHHPTPRPSANYGQAETHHQEPAAARIDPERRRQLAQLAFDTAKGMRVN